MNLNINSASSPNFGMAIKIDENAHKVIKKQVSKLSPKKADTFWENFDAAVNRQQDKPVNILIRKCKNRQALAAEVVDDNKNALNNKVFSQGILKPKGLKFLKKAEGYADNINELNTKLSKYEKALETDYNPHNIQELDIEA